MFNDISKSANSQSVDDIFAETDKIGLGHGITPATEVDTKKVGLASGEEEGPAVADKTNSPWFKIAIIAIVAVIVMLIGYLVYSRFFDQPKNEDNNIASTTPNNQFLDNNSVIPVSQTPVTPPVVETPVVPPVVDTSTTTLVSSATPVVVISVLDSDSDGLTDEEEEAYKTNPDLSDTDGDDLNDYEEVKIYRTDPIKPDTDDDGYKDGQEIKGGYNPNGPGRLPGYQAR